MKKIILLFTIIFFGTQVFAYQNPYQNMWFDGVWRKNCNFNVKLQQCESESMNFKSYDDYNKYHNGVNGYYCYGGKLYRATGFNQQLMLQTTSNGMPISCATKQRSPRIKTDLKNFGKPRKLKPSWEL